MVAIIGKSGAGKDTILNKVIELAPERFHRIINCTTRPIRENEKPDISYHFISSDKFMELCEYGQMTEVSSFNGWSYGTCYKDFDEDKINIGIFNPYSLDMLCDRTDIEVSIVYIDTKDKIRLLRQLNREEEPDIKEIIRRYTTDASDFSEFDRGTFSDRYEYFADYLKISNNGTNDVETTAKSLIQYFQGKNN